MKYTITNDSIIAVHDGKTYLVRSGAPNFAVLGKALRRGDEAAAVTALTAQGSVAAWHPRFIIEGGAVCFDRMPVAESFGRRVLAMVAGGEDPQPLLRFYERLSRNPSWRSTQQLFDFLSHEHLPIEADGHFLAYKGVRADYMDKYSGKFRNKPGDAHEMPRSEISDDPDIACHFGFHVGALSYAREYANGSGERIVVCRVDPEHVVCVPRDSNARKVRVCRYAVAGLFGQALSSTTMPAETSADERDELYQGAMAATVAQLMGMSRDELCKYLRKYHRVVGALPESRMELMSLAMDVSR